MKTIFEEKKLVAMGIGSVFFGKTIYKVEIPWYNIEKSNAPSGCIKRAGQARPNKSDLFTGDRHAVFQLQKTTSHTYGSMR